MGFNTHVPKGMKQTPLVSIKTVNYNQITPIAITRDKKIGSKLLRSREIATAFTGLLRQEGLVDVWQDTAIGDGNSSQKLAQFLVVAHRELYVPRNDTVLLVVPRRIPSKLQNLRVK